MTDSEVQRLDKIIAILQIAHKDEIDRARAEITADKVDEAILKATVKETPAGKVVKAAATKVKSRIERCVNTSLDSLSGVCSKSPAPVTRPPTRRPA